MTETPGSNAAADLIRRSLLRRAVPLFAGDLAAGRFAAVVGGLVRGLLGVCLVTATTASLAPAARAQSDEQVKAGLAAWRGSGCADCHGAFADGEKQRDEMPAGANLRSARLNAAGLKETIRCGRPGTGMPSFDQDAWKAGACNGQTPGAPPDDLFPAPAKLTPDEIDAVVAYLQARVIGKGRTVTKQECLFYYAGEADWCEDYK